MLYSFLLSSLLVVLLISASPRAPPATARLPDATLPAVGYMNRAALLPLLPEHIVERLPAALRAPPSGARYSRLSAFDWASQARAGLSSARFDIEANLRDGDARAGLDEIGSLEVNAVMASRNMVSALACVCACGQGAACPAAHWDCLCCECATVLHLHLPC